MQKDNDGHEYELAQKVIDFNLSIDEQFVIYPNPSIDLLNVQLYGYQYNKFQILNFEGKVVIDNTISKIKDSIFQIDISELSTGHYLLKLYNNKTYKIQKFYKKGN